MNTVAVHFVIHNLQEADCRGIRGGLFVKLNTHLDDAVAVNALVVEQGCWQGHPDEVSIGDCAVVSPPCVEVVPYYYGINWSRKNKSCTSRWIVGRHFIFSVSLWLLEAVMFFGNCRSSRDTAESRTLADLEVDAVSVVGIITICSWNRQPSNPCPT